MTPKTFSFREGRVTARLCERFPDHVLIWSRKFKQNDKNELSILT